MFPPKKNTEDYFKTPCHRKMSVKCHPNTVCPIKTIVYLGMLKEWSEREFERKLPLGN